MRDAGFPLCCTAKVITDFGETDTSGGRNAKVSKDALKKELSALVKEKAWAWRSYAVAIVILNSDQKEAASLLRELQFSRSEAFSKKQHADTSIKIWWIGMEDLLKKFRAL